MFDNLKMKYGVTLKICSLIKYKTLLWKNHAENVHQKPAQTPF